MKTERNCMGVSFRRDPTKTVGNCAAATAAQLADSKMAGMASGMWELLSRTYRWAWNDPDEAVRCAAKATAFYARFLELQTEEAGRQS